MANKLFLMGIGPQCGKGAAAFAIVDAWKKADKKIAFFRPLVSEVSAKDTLLERLLAHFKPSFSYNDAYAYTLAEARALVNEGKGSIVQDTILSKCKKLEENHDFVVCIGSDCSGADAMLEFTLNAQVAADLGAPALVLMEGKDRAPDDLGASMRGNVRALREAAVDVIACVLVNAPLSDEDAKKFTRIIQDAPEDQKVAHVNTLPEIRDNACPCSKPETALAYFADNMDISGLLRAVEAHKVTIVTPKMFEFALLERAGKHKMRIVLPEGMEDRILKAASAVDARGVADIILLGNEDAIKKRLGELSLPFKGKIINPATCAKLDEYVSAYYEARKAKGVTPEKAREVMLDLSYFGTMMVWKDDADGMVSGSINTTAHTIKPAFEFVKMKPGISTVSSIFLMCMKDHVMAFGDCAVNPNPTPEQLAGIAVSSAETARIFGVEPRVAMCSYSTGTSGKGVDVDAVIEATRLAKEKAPGLALDGPLQYDAAINMDVAKTKMPNSPVAGKATVFIFPDLNTGNNTYKAVQRAADAVAIGPILQGLNKPVNDLSRGCLVPDVINTIAITAVQAQAEKGLI
ncbi:hypothetical protein FACS1894206_00900 [Deltaproteobacteria bacterium]|nr:hypothetical protein FACS1894206_00900 [Deltaproteobacteria bacterium]